MYHVATPLYSPFQMKKYVSRDSLCATTITRLNAKIISVYLNIQIIDS